MGQDYEHDRSNKKKVPECWTRKGSAGNAWLRRNFYDTQLYIQIYLKKILYTSLNKKRFNSPTVLLLYGEGDLIMP